MAADTDHAADVEGAAQGHHDLVGQPHSGDEGPVAEAEVRAAEMSSDEQPLGALGPRFNRRSPFYIGLAASAGVAVTYGAVEALVALSSVLVLIGVAFFLALGLEPAVSWFVNRKLPRWAATTLVFGIFLASWLPLSPQRSPPLVQQAGELPIRRRTISSRPRTTRRRSVGSTTASICNSASPTPSTAREDRSSTMLSAREPRCSERSPTRSSSSF